VCLLYIVAWKSLLPRMSEKEGHLVTSQASSVLIELPSILPFSNVQTYFCSRRVFLILIRVLVVKINPATITFKTSLYCSVPLYAMLPCCRRNCRSPCSDRSEHTLAVWTRGTPRTFHFPPGSVLSNFIVYRFLYFLKSLTHNVVHSL